MYAEQINFHIYITYSSVSPCFHQLIS